MICSASGVEEVGKFDKVERKDGSGESKGTSEVEIHMNCPSNAGSWESELIDLREDTRSSSEVSSSAEVLGFEADDEMSTGTPSFLSEEESDNGEGEARNCAAEREPGPSGLHGTPTISLPPPRSSKWKQVYSKKLEQKEQLAEEKRKRKPRRRPRTKHVHSQEDEAHASKIRIIKRIKNAIKKAAARDPYSGHAALPTDETIAQIFGVAVEDCRDSSSDDCFSSSSSASTRPSTETSRNSLIKSDEDLEQQRTGRHFREVQTASASANNKPKKSVKTRSRVAASWESFSKSNKDSQKASAGRPCNRVNSTAESAKNGRKGANTTPANSWDSSTTLDEEFEEPKVERAHREIKSTAESEGNWQVSARTSSPPTNSWDSSTTLDEEFEERNVERAHNEIKSAAESEGNGQASATTSSPPTNSWDSSTTLDEEFEEPKVACSWPVRGVKSISDSVKNGKMGVTASAPITNSRDSPNSEEEPTSEATSSWQSSTILDEDLQKPNTPECEKNVQCGARARPCSASSWKTSTNSLEDLDQLTMESENNGQKKARKARKWFRFKSNKVAPL